MQAATDQDSAHPAGVARCEGLLAAGIGFNPSTAAIAARDRCEALVGVAPRPAPASVARGVAEDLVSALMFLLFATILAALLANTVPRDAA